MTKDDLPALVDIETSSSENFWKADDVREIAREPDNLVVVVTKNRNIVGFVAYQLAEANIYILNLVVHPDHRRCGVGSLLLSKVKTSLNKAHHWLEYDVREHNTTGHLFLKANDFKATQVILAHFLDYHGEVDAPDEEAAYRFCYYPKRSSNVQNSNVGSCVASDARIGG